MTNPIAGAEEKVQGKVRGIVPYIKAHWKELLALTFAAIPALFIIFHAGARNAAQQVLSNPAQLFGGPGGGTPGAPGPSGGGDPSSQSVPTPPPTATAPVSPTKTTQAKTATSVNGYNPISVPVPVKSTAPTQSANIKAIAALAPVGGKNISSRSTSGAPSVSIIGGGRFGIRAITNLQQRIAGNPPPAPAPAPAQTVIHLSNRAGGNVGIE